MKYVVKGYGHKTMTMNEQEFNQWVARQAKDNYGSYRIIGDRNSKHFYMDFSSMWEIKVVGRK